MHVKCCVLYREMGMLFGECSPPLGERPNCFPENSGPFMVGTNWYANAFSQA